MNHTLLINMLTAKVLELMAMPDPDDEPIPSMSDGEFLDMKAAYEAVAPLVHKYAMALREIERLRARILELEAAAAMQRGTLTTMESQQRDDGGVRFTWNVPPSTPPNELP